MVKIDLNFKRIIGGIQVIGGLVCLGFSYFFSDSLGVVIPVGTTTELWVFNRFVEIENFLLVLIFIALIIFGISQILQGLVNIKEN